jgi:hypothetical protein
MIGQDWLLALVEEVRNGLPQTADSLILSQCRCLQVGIREHIPSDQSRWLSESEFQRDELRELVSQASVAANLLFVATCANLHKTPSDSLHKDGHHFTPVAWIRNACSACRSQESIPPQVVDIIITHSRLTMVTAGPSSAQNGAQARPTASAAPGYELPWYETRSRLHAQN